MREYEPYKIECDNCGERHCKELCPRCGEENIDYKKPKP